MTIQNVKFLFLICIITFSFLIFNIASVSAHFVKSDSGIGAVLHVDPGDDPVAGEQSNFILEYKDTNNKFDLTNCDCKLTVLENGEEIFSTNIEAVAPDQKLSSVTTFTFPEKNVYQLKINGSSKDGSYQNFELTYDVRVEKDSLKEATATKETNWFSEHVIHLVGGFVVVGFLVFALIFQNRKKVAVIILALLILGHSIPVKAIHASHEGPISNESFVCCLPVAADITEFPEIEEQVFKNENFPELLILNTKYRIPNTLTIRPPPFSF